MPRSQVSRWVKAERIANIRLTLENMEEDKVAGKVIQVLMSTYNGDEYLKEQIDSILAQDCEKKAGTKLKLLIRDDGSKDGTQKILGE